MVINKNNLQWEFSLKERILIYLLENKEKAKTIRQISADLKADYKNTFNALDSLSHLISKEKFGSNNMIRIKSIPDIGLFSIENKRTNNFLNENKKIELIRKDIESLNYPFFIVLLFGSYIGGTKTEKLDIDLCIISDSKEKTKSLMNKLEILLLNLEIYDFTTEEFESMIQTKKDNVGKEIVKKNIILFGIENYYNLVSKWMKTE